MNTKPNHPLVILPTVLWAVLVAQGAIAICSAVAQEIDYVIHVSVDGLRPDTITNLGPTNLPNFYRMRTEGAYTDNARTDYDYTVTLPSHFTQLTGRGVLGAAGHGWTLDNDPAAGQTLASNKKSYVAGVFDVVHDHGLRAGEYASKTKFSLFDTSWNATNGAPDTTGADNGRDKIDIYYNTNDTAVLVGRLVANMATQALHYAFIHLTDPDTVGHASGWTSGAGAPTPYSNIIKTMDSRLGVLFSLITTNAQLAGRTAILLTADHGGSGTDHANAALKADYTVPLYVWGPGVMAGAPLYVINPATRLDPGTARPSYAAPVQPIRNGEAANVVLLLFSLPPVPGSTINLAQNLALTVSPPTDFRLLTESGSAGLAFGTMAKVLYDVQARDDLNSGPWVSVATNIVGTGGVVTVPDPASPNLSQRFYRLRLHF